MWYLSDRDNHCYRAGDTRNNLKAGSGRTSLDGQDVSWSLIITANVLYQVLVRLRRVRCSTNFRLVLQVGHTRFSTVQPTCDVRARQESGSRRATAVDGKLLEHQLLSLGCPKRPRTGPSVRHSSLETSAGASGVAMMAPGSQLKNQRAGCDTDCEGSSFLISLSLPSRLLGPLSVSAS